MRAVRTATFYLMLLVSTVILGVAAIVIVLLTRRQDWAHLCGRLWGNLNLWAAGVKVQLQGVENIEPGTTYILAANHQGWFDIFAILGKIPVQFRWLAKEELFRIPLFGHAMRSIGYIPIDRADRRKALESLATAAEQVRRGTSIVIFPEGTRSLDGVLQNFKKGGILLAIRSQQPILPISISGSHKILPKKGTIMIRPGTIRMTIGKPIPTRQLTVKDRDLLMERLREAIRMHLLKEEGGGSTTRDRGL
ncbi:lysophospholipid acyltransferase family protein [Desulfoglaeba alkanexedens]|uniref:1-acyl-sn-glycerol-3-phosphate acyltransferase n=1 Tax=Desulfoglaeba alkanexedens ALDC TaxID=980445 RepID=A0A4P8L330_9BACT|nr:lysophospholipid acyltransferase family protein [Desulfoglaeba alkanexedens]QCQ22346.1 1-acyl-sn-glycerol-3-phosphate acyltransferase [Desulfoglaeba alkanexedens ALDC]